jgi:hypothetical protein
VLHADRVPARVRVDAVDRKVVEHRVLERDRAVRDEGRHGGRRERLRQRVEQMHAVGPVRLPPALGDDPAVTGDGDAVQLDAGAGDGVEETGDASGVDTLRAGSGGRETHVGDGTRPEAP